ncbi:ATP-binding protein [Chryseolinea sp. H1M3-3]|uniref:ATP-binding protein n=1 Tax=Chryseolinea sp. H1M3-3 TaxID=3034144 RepID=UPI0023EC44FC|nr:ATP-binding protein [Chryseolinea sp. H1M3-3]
MDKTSTITTVNFLSGGGEMGERIRSYDWGLTSLGPVDLWPRSLKTCIQIMLTSRQPIWIGWGKELIKLYNDPYKTIVGGKHPGALGSPASEVWRDIWEDISPMLKKVMEENEGTYVEAQLLIMERNGYPEETYYTFSYTPIAGDDGNTEGMICANTDDTHRIITERQLQTLTQLGKSLTDSKSNREVFEQSIKTIQQNPYDFPFALFYQLSGNKLSLAQATELGDSASQVPAHIDLLAQDDISQLCVEALGQRKFLLVDNLQEKFGVMPAGAWKIPPNKAIILPIAQRGQKEAYGLLVIGANPFRILDEKYCSFFELVGDQIVTSLANVHAMEEERKRLEALAEIDRAKTIFFSNISHEFRTPLTLFLGPLEDLLNDREIQGVKKEKVEVAFRNALRMQKMVNLLLDFSKIEAGRMESNFSPVDIVALTTDLASNFRSAIEKAGMKLNILVDEIHEPVFVDVNMWEKIILNLLSNAFKYSEAGTIDLTIKKIDDTVRVSVKDTGVGIPETEMDKIFDRFHRVQNVKGRTQEGTGIGLAMVKELVKLHNGTIEVKSKIGEGSEFTVCIPQQQKVGSNGELKTSLGKTSTQLSTYVEEALQWIPSKDTTHGESSDVLPSSSTNGTIRKYTILLADDNADMRTYVERLLQKQYHVILAADGEDGLAKALKHTPDLILSDIMMPKLDGFGLLKRLKDNLTTRNIPFIFLSARAGEESKVEGIQAGADDYLIKPFSSKELIARVNNHISISTARRHAEKEFFNLFLQSPAHIHVFKGPDHVVEFFHPLGISFTGRDVTGMKIREAFPEVEGQGFFEMLDKVYHEGITINARNSKAVITDKNGKANEHYFDSTYLPWKDLEGKTQGVLQFTIEVTEAAQLRLMAEANELKFRSIAQQAPVAMALLMGPTFIVEVANTRVLEMWGKTLEEVIGQPVLNIFPEIIAQGFQDILTEVFKTGNSYTANEVAVTFMRGERKEQIVVNLLYEPFRNAKNEIEGIVAVGTDVTEQVKIRNKVAEAELKFRTIIEQTPSPLCIFKGEDMVLEVGNDAALGVWQVGKEVIGKRLVDIVPEMLKQPFLALMQDVYHNGVTRYGYEAPAFFIRKDGTADHRFFNFIYVPFRNVNGIIEGVLVLATDVTEQVQAKKQLVENEERLRIATEILELGTWEYDIVNDAMHCSDKTLELFGFPKDAKIKLIDPINAIVQEDRQRVIDAIEYAFKPESNGKYDVEYSLININDKKKRLLRANGQVFFDADSKPYRFIGTALDITERKEAEEELKASEARFKLLANSIPQIVWTNDKYGKTNYISTQFEKYTGQKAENSHALWHNSIHADDQEKLLTKRQKALQRGQGWQEEFRIKTKEGNYRWFLADSKPLTDADGNIVMWVGSASDIQDLKEQSNWLERQVQERTRALKELNESLKLSNEDLQQFAHVASHDLKEPIRKIKTYSNRLYDDYKELLPEKGNNFLTKILSATDRMYSMIDGVLSYSTMAALSQPTQQVNLNEVLHHIQNDLEVLTLEKNATIISDRLPTIEGAPVLLYQLFYNLVNNSLKFSKKEEPPVIKIKAFTETIDGNPFVKIILSDNGIGFDEEDAERIFTTFTRLNSKDKYDGTGLGLALCKKIVHRHSGLISAKGTKNVGAEFTVLLPIIK